MPSSVTLQALGLNISQNQLQAPEGSLLSASNVIIRRSGVLESRRGFKLYGDTFGTSSARASQLFAYKSRILRHYDSTLQYDDGSGVFSSFAGEYHPTQTGLRMKSVEANGNFYFTTSDGIQKISATNASQFTTADGYITKAGGIKAVDITTYLDTSPSSDPWFLNDSTVAYRVVWGIKDANENLILGSPSERSVIYNYFDQVIIKDFLNVLGALDNLNQTGSLITDGDYVETLKLPISSPATDIRTNLIALAAKIDTDILIADVGGPAPIDMAGQNFDVTSNVLTINFVAGPTLADYFLPGSHIFISNLNAAVNGAQTIASVGASSITVNITTTNIPATAIPGGTLINSGEFRNLTEPGTVDNPATHQELQDLDDYLDSIIFQLQSLPQGIISTSLKAEYIDVLVLTIGYTVTLQITIPSGVTTNHFYQIYRTPILTAIGTDVLSELSPSDEMRLVYEANPTQAEIDTGIVVIEDITPDDFAGANLYTNPSTGEGLLQANDIPPLSKDIARFKDYIFYANTTTKHRLQLQMLGVSNIIDVYDTSGTPSFTITDGTNTNTYSFVVGTEESTDITCTAKAAIPVSGYFLISSAYNRTQYYVWFDTTGSDPDPAVSGRTGIKVDVSFGGVVTASDVAQRLTNVLSQHVDDFNVSNLAAVVTVTNTSVGESNDFSAGTSGFSGVVTQGIGEKATQEISQFTCVADVAGSLAGKYFTINTAFNQNLYYVWYRVSGSGIDPAVANKTGIMVDLVTNDSASTVATKTSIVLNALLTKFVCTTNSAILTITNYRYGPAVNSTVGTSGFSLSITQQGALDVALADLTSVAQSVDQTVRSLVRIINLNKTEIVYAFNISSTEDLPGKILLESKDLSDIEFFLQTDSSATGNSFSPTIVPEFQISAISAAPTTIVTTSTNHGLATGDFVVLSHTNSLPSIDGLWEVTVTGLSTFTILKSVAIAGTAGAGSNSINANVSENERKPNRIYYSKFQQPEAVPIVNNFDVGGRDQAILRIYPLRDSLFVFKEDGLFRVSGETAPFSVGLFDDTAKLISADSVASTNNQIFGWLNQGIGAVTESGVTIMSRGIDIDLLKIQTHTNFTTATFGIGYDSDSSYTVYTVTKDTDELASLAYRYSTLTNSWTTFDRGSTCGIIFQLEDKMYLGASDKNQLEVERKTFSRKDYADRQYDKNIDALTYANNQITFSSVSDIDVGDVILQTQYVTTYKFNIFLKKLDNDTTLTDSNYYSTLVASNGVNMSTKLDLLIVKVRDDAGRLAAAGHTASSFYTALLPTSSTFSGLQGNYNAFITLLNNDAGVGYSNYSSITDSTDFETVVTAVDTISKKITIKDSEQFIEGPVIIYKSIATSVIWSAQTMGDPLSLKQIYQATLMLEARTFTDFSLSFASDLLPSFKSIEFTGDSNGAFGVSNPFGENYFGGISNSAPLRTIIPRDKQRCRYLVVRYDHSTAFEQYAVLGITLTGNTTSERGFR